MAHEGYHEPYEKLTEHTREMHRAILSLMEELEAVDWYYQRADVTEDPQLKAILLHNAHEEIEHAMMTLEWIRRSDPKFDANMREYLFKQGSIVGNEAAATGKAAAPAGEAPALPSSPIERAAARPMPRRTLGSLRGGKSE